MKSKTVSALEGETFVVTDQRGDVDSSPEEAHGLFHGDTRFLSRWVLTVDGQKPNSLSVDDVNYFASQFFLVPGTGAVYIDSPISILRQRAVGGGFHEDLKLMNHTEQPRDIDVRVEAGADFADLFQVKDALSGRKGEFYHRIEPNRLVLGYKRDRFVRETWITTSAPGEIDEKGFHFRVHLGGHGEWSTSLDVSTALDGSHGITQKPKYKDAHDVATPNGGVNLRDWMAGAPQLRSSWSDLPRSYERAAIDLAALRFFPALAPGQALPAAGLPWFMALFGRDSLITSFQALPFFPDLAATALRVLGARQGVVRDDFRDEEPGRILHEARRGEMTAFEERPHSPYFGTSDATPLFLILLDEYERWSGNKDLVKSLESNARAALEWIDKYGDRDHDGYIEYERRNPTGLENQCWKDSGDSIRFPDGSKAKPPIATCEIQGYVYDAKRRVARLARELWNDSETAARLESEAAELKRRFNRDFWVPRGDFFALALDRDKRQVDSLTSNIGHLLWSGIVEQDKAPAIARHLLSDDLFSGWGVRTMAAREGGYNPIGYHIGTVWPFDNSIIAAGLRRYGFRVEAAQIAFANLEAARYFDYRLPEAFAGYSREQTQFPVEYPTACSPQAWSAGAPLLFIRAMLGLEPVDERLLVDPAVPKQIEWLELLGIPGRWGRADAFARGLIELPARPAATPAPRAMRAASAG
ncbi:MAG TPA: glycogen debranching N-terminal domain-containing protein [Candidatus Acidoferrales bacterium]|nr:glycogen debranching N-terminal domain-containing protein [Candidatus Acidoferrales bacterium]